MTPSPMFRTLTQCVGVDTAQAQAWWQALTRAQWSEARSWLADVRYFDAQPRTRTARLDGVVPFLRQTSPPSRVVVVVEALVQEQLLTRAAASAIEEGVLRCVNSRGEWFWSQ